MRDQVQHSINAVGLRAGLIVSRYHQTITMTLAEGAREAFVTAGGNPSHIIEISSPGAFELPQIARTLADSGRVDCIVALGCVIQGETSHFDYICQAVAHGLMSVALDTGISVAFGVLTCMTLDQAHARAGGEHGNKGVEAMRAAIESFHARRLSCRDPKGALP